MSQAVEVTDCVKNWSDIKASYSRKDLGGVVRQISSEIEFVGVARDMIVQEIETNYLHAEACFAIYTIDDNWNYNQRWSCPLDFSSFEDDGNVCKLGSIDNSAAALIKSKKSTKFEYEDYNTGDVAIGAQENVFHLRLFCDNKNDTNHKKVTTGGPAHDTRSLTWFPNFFMRFYDPETGEDVPQPSTFIDVDNHGQNSGDNGEDYDGIPSEVGVLKAIKECWIDIDPGDTVIKFKNISTSGWEDKGIIVSFCGQVEGYRGTLNEWHYRPKKQRIRVKAGQFLYVAISLYIYYNNREHIECDIEIPSQRNHPDAYTYFTFDTSTQGEETQIYDAASASTEEVANKICNSIGGTETLLPEPLTPWSVQRIRASISNDNGVATTTRIVPASAIRNLAVDKLHTSFNDFAGFMAACFGYDYTIERKLDHYYYIENIVDKRDGSKHQCIAFEGIELADVSLLHENYINFWGSRQYLVRSSLGAPLKLKYIFDEETVNTPVLYRGGQKWTLQYSGVYLHDLANDIFYRTGTDENGHWGLQGVDADYDWSEDEGNVARYDLVEFKHRSRMFDDASVKVLKNVNSFSIKYASDVAYSTLKIGAEQQNYEDMGIWLKKEFNGLYQYTTGAKTSDKELTLVTPFRIDGNGVQYKIYQRNTESKQGDDKTEDKDLFAIVCNPRDDAGGYAPSIEGIVQSSTGTALPAGMINERLHPRFMVEANKELIGISTDLLTYASCDGNSQVTVDGILATDDIDIDARMAKAFRVEIETSDIDEPENFNGLVQFDWNGKTYQGYILDADFKFAEESVKYTLLVKNIA